MNKELNFYKITKENYSKKELVLEYARRLYPERTPPIKAEISLFIKQLKKGNKILDFGCGTGKDVGYFRKMGFSAIGYDYSMEMVKYATNEYGNLFYVNDILAPNHSAEKFNGIFSLALIQHILKKDFIHCMNNFDRLLIKDGILCIITKRGTGTDWDYRLGVNYQRRITYYSSDDFNNFFANKNYKILHSGEFSLFRENVTDNWLSFIAQKKI